VASLLLHRQYHDSVGIVRGTLLELNVLSVSILSSSLFYVFTVWVFSLLERKLIVLSCFHLSLVG
jgi:hypothetical protein